MGDYYVYLADGTKRSIWTYNPVTDAVALPGYKFPGSSSSNPDDPKGTDPDAGVKWVGDHKEATPPTNNKIVADYTQYETINWINPCKPIYDDWVSKGKLNSYHVATIKGRYLVAVAPICGKTGDAITIVLDNDKEIDAIIADTKGADKQNTWGHVYSGKVSVVEFEVVYGKTSFDTVKTSLKNAGWLGRKVTKIKNYGNYTKLI